MRLICEPVAAAGLRYDDLALEKMWRVTAGQPYFLQLLCYTIVSRQNQQRRSYVVIDDVNAALDELLGSGEAHFIYLWTESSAMERLVLSALSRVMPLGGQIETEELATELEGRGAPVERLALDGALHRLTLRDILVTGDGDRQNITYRWKLGLLGLWVERARLFSRVVEEAR